MPDYAQSIKTLCITLPSTSPSEIHEMVRYQAPGLVPYPKEEISFDYEVIDSDIDGYSRVLIVIAHQKALDEILLPLHQVHLEPDIIQLRSAALANFYLAAGARETTGKINVLIDRNAEIIDISFLLNNRLVGSRGISLTRLPPAEVYAHILAEYRQGTAILKEELGERSIGKIVLLAGGNQEELSDFLSANLSLPVEQFSFSPGISLAKSLSDRDEEIRALPSMPAIIGACLAPANFSGIFFNLLPSSIKKKKEIAVQRWLLFRKISMAMVLLFFLIVNLTLVFSKTERRVQELQAQIKRIEPVAAGIQQKKQNLDLIKSEITPDFSVLDIVDEIYRITPKTVFLSSLDIEIGEVAILNGQAQELSQVFDYITILEESSFFQDIRANYATRRRVGDKQMVSFEFYCHFSPNTR